MIVEKIASEEPEDPTPEDPSTEDPTTPEDPAITDDPQSEMTQRQIQLKTKLR